MSVLSLAVALGPVAVSVKRAVPPVVIADMKPVNLLS